MARLNEVPAPTESIESLKRKFMRQNRDIARTNSTQSLRIRNLENEVSRLLAENLGLNEQIIRLANQLENGKAQRTVDHTEVVKSQLEAKLLEIGALITSLGDVPPRKKRISQGGRTTQASPSTSPDQKRWKNICTLSEAVAGQEGRLPPILEDKAYPRQTLECVQCVATRSILSGHADLYRHHELVNLVSEADARGDTTDSPEIGPPPVSQFVDEDPVKIDLPKRGRKNDLEDLTGLDPAQSINLEQRRKRKDSLGPNEPKHTNYTQATQVAQANAGSLKTGAKRKFSVRDDEEHQPVSQPVQQSPDDFKFTRVSSEDRAKNKPVPQPENAGSKSAREVAVARGAREKRTSTTATTTATNRRALAPKNVNDSPRKSGKPPDQLNAKAAKAAKADVPKFNLEKDRTRDRNPEQVIIKPRDEPLAKTIEVELEPETPAGLDIFSPSSSQPSTARVESRDTPPPPDLHSEGQRPSRRARGAVSYAEPSLRDKMRRPTKDLVDAVTGEGKSSRGSIVKLEDDSISARMSIKAEPEEEDAWKRMPLASSSTVENSPLRNKALDQEALPSSITTHRKRRESLLHQLPEDMPRTVSETAISALISEHRKAKAAAKVRQLEKDGVLTKATENLDIYEFNDNSPARQPSAAKTFKEERPASRSSRRQSSIPPELVADLAGPEDGEASDIEATKKEPLTTRRRQSTLGLKTSSTRMEPAKTTRNTTVTANLPDPAAGDSRGDRIAARRRSMML
ncbi:Shugoshin [Lachnellula hyalina]|uniref:Shugoshin n=1 Tax=Lachnellula hyalina TaxID=1316788 RepID=A0A8H8QT37_9HELO|nr:Shugoshin [Lachnellula hyalina]TVY22303.1 Shugoshin [Lachnellula hyalina]